MTPKLQRVIRLDSLPLGQTIFTSEGYLIDRPVLTTTGIFEYTNSDGSVRRELRLPEEVFAEDSLKSYKGKPIIITHEAGLINKDNVDEEMIGTILGDGYQSGDDVRAEIVIHDTNAMRQCGLKELSLGYNLDLDETEGEWNGQHYDAIQRNIRINHLALVRDARAGEHARLNIDSRDGKTNILKGGKVMLKKKKASRADGVLSQEELQKAIEMYKAHRAEQEDSDDAETEEVAVDEETPVEEETAEVVETDEEEVAPTEEEKPDEEETETVEGCKKVIERQDADMKYLFDIIDTLLAEREFDEAEETEEEVATDEDEVAETEDVENADDDEETEEEIVEDEDDEETEIVEDEDDEEETEIVEDEDDEEETEIVEDEDDEEEAENCDEDNDDAPIPSRTDSVDKLVKARVQLGMIGRQVGIEGLEDMDIIKGKKAIIKNVRPNMRLDGKSSAFIDAAYAMAVDEIKTKAKKDTKYQKKQMFNKKVERADSAECNGAEAHRAKMIKKMKSKEAK